MSSLPHPADATLSASNQNEQDAFAFFNVAAAMQDAQSFHDEFSATMSVGTKGVTAMVRPAQAQQTLRNSSVVDAVLAKIGSRNFAKRNPQETQDYAAYVTKCFEARDTLLFRVPVGPVKNVVKHGDYQSPDLAEYLMFMQLARFVAAVAALYPYGVKVQIVPDDVRARTANRCPDEYVHSYVGGLHRMVAALGFSSWMHVEDGQMRLCDLYKVTRYSEAAEAKLLRWKQEDPESFAVRWETALINARKNFAAEQDENYEEEVAASAWRYLIAYHSEVLSGMWSPIDAFPLIYAHQPQSYQLYSLGYKKTKLPWQISLPTNLLPPERLPAFLRTF